MASLKAYREKRDFSRTAEPSGKSRARGEADPVFVVHKHAARRLHYDLRLEHDGVLWSWAVTRGPSLDPSDKRLAVHVEDHPFDYRDFEGTIPKGEYGGGSVIVWDEGSWRPEGDPAKGMAKGHLAFTLEGSKLRGAWHLVRLKPRRGETRDNWLLIKSEDEAARADGDILEEEPRSVLSGRTVEEVADGVPAPSPRARSKGQSGAGKGARAKAAKAKTARSETTKVKSAKAKATKAKASRAKPTREVPAKAGRQRAGSAARGFIAPALATLRSQPPSGRDWVHEIKFDGYRIQAHCDDGDIRLYTRSGLDWTGRFGKGLADALAALPCQSAILDGEVVVPGDHGLSSFSALQDALSEGRTGDMVLYAFDLLFLDGEDLRDEPLLARKERLAHLLDKAPQDGPVRYSEHFVEPGARVLGQSCRMGLEGIVSKRSDAPYRSGRRQDWVKSKCSNRQEFAIAGYLPSSAAGRGIRSLVMAYRDKGQWKPAGRVGTGFSGKEAVKLKSVLDALKADASPFAGKAGRERGVVWLRPEAVAEVSFGSFTASGTLRHAVYKGLREDKPADEVVAERPEAEGDASPDDGTAGGGKTGSRNAGGSKPAANRAKPRASASRMQAGTQAVRLSNPDKVLWPQDGLTKAGLLAHYEQVWARMEPHVVGRPLSLLRAPDGIDGETFFQKHASKGMNAAIAVAPDAKDGEDLLFVRDFDGIAALVQLGVVEIHVWGATMDAIETPDQMIFDLDPGPGVKPAAIPAAALEIRDRLAELGLASFCKVSGGKGYHVAVPLKPKAGWDRVKTFSHDFARAIAQAEPDRYTATLSKKARTGRIFIDYLRNGRGATAVAPFSVRARPGAGVSVPVSWAQVEKGIAPDAFAVGSPDLKAALRRADPWAGFRDAAVSLR